MRKTKIICTLGPSTDNPEVIRGLIERGMDVARLNFSHGSRDEHLSRIHMVREVARQLGRPVAVMLDTRGPEIRTGRLKSGRVKLVNGQRFILTTRDIIGDENQVKVSFDGLPEEVKPGDRILLSDGFIQLVVEEVVEKQDVVCQVVYGGELGERKGVNIPGVRTKMPYMNDQDRADISFGLEHGVDIIAASFVTTPEDILQIRQIVEERNSVVDIIAKIESQDGVNRLDDIIKVADGVMVARGDLGVDIPTEEVPLVQKAIIKRCNEVGRVVIIATQMLESMINNPRPTRAEASDVANAIFDGADAIMLSGETAAGRYPQDAVGTMARIACRTEEVLPYTEILLNRGGQGNRTVTDAISYATCTTAESLGISTIITATQSGSTARMVSKHRPRSHIIAATPDEGVARRLNLVWGVTPLLVKRRQGTDQMIEEAVTATINAGLIREGEMVVITAGVPTGVPGTTNLLKVHIIAEVLLTGTGIGEGSASGVVRLVERPLERMIFNEGDILVTRSTNADFIPLIQKAGAVLVEEGGLTSHAAIVGLNLGVPVVVGVEGAMERLKNETLVTVDTARGQVYKGLTKVF